VDNIKFQKGQLVEKLKQLKLLAKLNDDGTIHQIDLDKINEEFRQLGLT
jgi:hypothetical protein